MYVLMSFCLRVYVRMFVCIISNFCLPIIIGNTFLARILYCTELLELNSLNKYLDSVVTRIRQHRRIVMCDLERVHYLTFKGENSYFFAHIHAQLL